MKTTAKTKVRSLSVLLMGALLALGTTGALFQTPRLAQAQNVFRSDILGHWKSRLGDSYTLRSNGTYTFFTIPGAKAISHSGTWSLRDHRTTLCLHATRRVVLEGRRRRTLRINKTFDLAITSRDPETITLDGAVFHRPIRD
jgi:hypothetical protein